MDTKDYQTLFKRLEDDRDRERLAELEKREKELEDARQIEQDMKEVDQEMELHHKKTRIVIDLSQVPDFPLSFPAPKRLRIGQEYNCTLRRLDDNQCELYSICSRETEEWSEDDTPMGGGCVEDEESEVDSNGNLKDFVEDDEVEADAATLAALRYGCTQIGTVIRV